MSDWDLVVIGAGAAGLLAACRAAERGRRVLLLEKNDRPGVKILMSGGTRCNLTHRTDERGIAHAFGDQGRFLQSALAALGPRQLIQLFHDEGVPTKVEEATGKIFPRSDKASDIVAALARRATRAGVTLALGEPLAGLQHTGNDFVLETLSRQWRVPKVLLTTGGQSYPGAGTSGDGYAWARQLGHSIEPPRPALTPITTDAQWVRELRGITIGDVRVRVVPVLEHGSDASREMIPDAARRVARQRRGPIAEARGSFLFTHFGLSGPVILDVSRAVSACPDPRRVQLACDLAPDEPLETLAGWLDTQAASDGKKLVGNILATRLPRRLVDAILVQATVVDRRVAEIGKRERRQIVDAIKGLVIPVSGVMGFRKAEVTAGGVVLAEVDSRDMQSKRVPGLYFAGEILDIDGPIGGYNFQAAFSTGWLAADRL